MMKKLINFLMVLMFAVCCFVNCAGPKEHLDNAKRCLVHSQVSGTNTQTHENFWTDLHLSQNLQKSAQWCQNISTAKNLKGEELTPYYEFNLSYGGHTYTLHYDTLSQKSQNFMINEQSKKWGRDGNHKEAVFALSTLVKMGVEPDLAFDFLFPDISQRIDKILDKVNILPKNSKILFTPNLTRKFTITLEKNGYVVNKDKLYALLLEKFSESPVVSVNLKLELTTPNVSRQDNKDRTQLLSKFKTSIATSSSERQNNVKLALKQFNGLKIEPNQVVSFNSTTGRRTAEKGYKQAHIILDGQFVDGVGGGVCQSSTTLYNALLLADNVDIIEANRHSMPVSYVELGFDAMVAYGSSDLRFKNVGDYPIYICTYSKDNFVYAEIYGKKLDNGIKKKRRSKVLRYIKPKADIIKIDKDNEFYELMDENCIYRQKKSADGMEVQTYLDYYKDGERIATKKIRHTTYPAQQGIIYKGTPKIEGSEEKTEN